MVYAAQYRILAHILVLVYPNIQDRIAKLVRKQHATKIIANKLPKEIRGNSKNHKTYS